MTSSRFRPRTTGSLLPGAILIACYLLGPPLRADTLAPPVDAPPLEAYRFSVDPKINGDVVGVVQVTHARYEDTMSDMARRFSVGYNEMHRANPGVDMWLPGAGRQIVLPTQFVLPDAPHVGIVVNAAQMRLYYFAPRAPGGQQVIYTYPIGIGRVSWKTPSGVTTVVRKVKNPVWRPPADIRKEHREEGDPLPAAIGPGPDDPMGNRALYLGWPEYAIHGTNKPAGVGMRVSHGCMHLYPEDIVQLYDMIPVGTQVRVVNQPFVFGWYRGDLYMQAFGPLAGDQRDWKNSTRRLLEQAMGPQMRKELQERNEQVRWDLVMQLARDPSGVPVAITEPKASLEQVLADARRVQNRLPDGAAWDGKTGHPKDEKTSERTRSNSGRSALPHPISHTRVGKGAVTRGRPARVIAAVSSPASFPSRAHQ